MQKKLENIQTHVAQNNMPPQPNIKNIIVVASAKGGVGKSTTAVNLALALKQLGAEVGLLDADIYGPSLPILLGQHERAEVNQAKQFMPQIAYDLQTMSIGYLIDQDAPAIWRGPMVTGALKQLLNDTQWQPMDYLIIDMPPGTGDIQLTLAQKIPVSGAVIVTTPQDVACQDAIKGLQMFNKVNIKVLGIVENMSMHTCKNCGHQEAVFGTGGAEKIAANYGTQVLGRLPLALQIREDADAGRPTVVADPDSDYAQAYLQLAYDMAQTLAQQPKNYAGKFGNIKVE